MQSKQKTIYANGNIQNGHFHCTMLIAYRSDPNTILHDWKATIILDFPTNLVTIWH